ncbi:MAG: hypothetical protein IJ469_08810 [Candidatus Methanomethylophilaceae archaeon]|nr:hypothetical protein [Candidatus Methanomethylophilaceae archaeon]
MERNNRCVLEADAEPVGMIPTWNQQQTTVQMPYVQLKGGKVRRPVEAEVENEFSTSSTNRRGAGGRGSIARYGVEYVRVMDRHYAPSPRKHWSAGTREWEGTPSSSTSRGSSTTCPPNR